MKSQYDDLFKHAPKLSNAAKNKVLIRLKSKESKKGKQILPVTVATILIVASSIFLLSVISPNNSLFEFKTGNGQPQNENSSLVVNEELVDSKERDTKIKDQLNREVKSIQELIIKEEHRLEHKKNQLMNESMDEKEINLGKKLLKDSEVIYRALEQLDYETISSMVHPQLGVTFTVYADYGNPNHRGDVPYKSFNREELLEKNNEIVQFGSHYAIDKIYEMTLNEFIQDLLINHYNQLLPIREISYNEPLFPQGGIINTIHQYYPEAKYVEYFRYESIDDPISYQSLRFVYQAYQGEWYLTAIVRDVHSP